ncbi:DUF1801 domain-containing protein [Ideonella livida]|uniref:DUF1801 domain-containing protein n=1 Tax=Ideonella livida TaxID=2707176 RepID=A0A7C9TKV9_9BURK|nr:DUF1801 domain-containing protein [Ideonella livida]NDY91565.1 DUF1801 domain-containing protein [Ideonella livida]
MRSSARPKALVAAWFDFLSPAQRPACEVLQRAVRLAVPEVQEAVKWGNLVFSVNEVVFMALVPHKAHVHLQVLNGSLLPPGLAPLEGTGRGSRNLRVRLTQPVDVPLVEALAAASAQLARGQVRERPWREAPAEGGTA